MEALTSRLSMEGFAGRPGAGRTPRPAPCAAVSGDRHEETAAIGRQKGQRAARRGRARRDATGFGQSLGRANGAGLTMVPTSSAHKLIPQLTPGTRGKRSRK